MEQLTKGYSLIEDFDSKEIAIIRVACKFSLKTYIATMHKYTAGVPFTFKHFHDKTIRELEKRAKYETTKNLILNLPVGFGKSSIVEYFLSWCFLREKNLCFLYTSYSDPLITKLSSEIKELMLGETYQALVNYQFKKDKNSKSNWSILGSVGRSGLTAGSIGGTITGLDAGNPAIQGFCGALIIDDPMKAGDEIFESKKQTVVDHFTRKLRTRLRRSDVPIILIMQRLDEDDLTGYIKSLDGWEEDWDCIEVKALVAEKSIWEEKVSTRELLKERENQPFVFYPQRQQDPNREYNTSFKGIRFEDDVTKVYNGLGHIDKGFDGEDGVGFSIVKEFIQEDGSKGYYVFGKLWEGAHIDDHLKEIEFYREKLKCGTIYTENNDDKGYLVKNNKNIKGYHEKQNKHFKIMSYLYPTWKNIYFVPETDTNYIKQIQTYNEKAKHDEAPDSLASIIRVYQSNLTKVIGIRPF